MQAARAEGRPLMVMMLDIDHFKQINDLHGHPFGDAVLVEVASRLKHSLRSDDLAGRYGGDELVIMLNNANWETAQAIGNRFRQAIIHAPIVLENTQQEITISLGVSCTGGGQKLTLVELVDQADQALLRAKQAGRDRVVLYEGEAG